MNSTYKSICENSYSEISEEIEKYVSYSLMKKVKQDCYGLLWVSTWEHTYDVLVESLFDEI
jgi:hypothetical protein